MVTVSWITILFQRGKGGYWVFIGVLKASLCMKLRWSTVYGAGKGKVMWSGPGIIVMIALSRKKSMQYVLLEAQEAAEQCVIIVLDELSCCWPVSRVQTSPDSTTNDSFDAVSIIRRRDAPPGAGRVEQFGKHDGSVDSLQRLVVHAVAAQHSDDVQ